MITRAVAVQEALDHLRQVTAAVPDKIAVAVELTRGVLVDTLLDQGFRVFAINPKQLDRFRDRFTSGGAKDDRREARVAADGLRTDPRAFRALRPEDPRFVPLRELSRMLDDLQTQEARLANALREQLYRVHAAWLVLSPAANDPWVWEVLRDAPHPAAWPTLPRRRLTSILRAHRIRRVTAAEVVRTLHQPTLSVAAGVPDAVALRIATLIPQLQLTHEQFRMTERQIDQLLATLAQPDPLGQPHEHRDVEILQSLPGAGRVVTATMLSEASGPLADRDYGTLRGPHRRRADDETQRERLFVVRMRYACKARLRQALYHWSRTSIQHDPSARAYYDRMRARGHSHGRALRNVGDRWLRILIAMLKTRTLYDVKRVTQAETVPA